LVDYDGGFQIFLVSAFHGFSGFAKKVTSCSSAKAVIPRHRYQLEESMASLVSLSAVVWVVKSCQADYGRLNNLVLSTGLIM